LRSCGFSPGEWGDDKQQARRHDERLFDFTQGFDRKESRVAPALSIVLPVHNAQDSLAGQLCQVLEVLPDLAERFEVLVIDDGSTDQTSEIAAEIAREFPQLRLVRHGRRRGLTEAIQTGMQRSRGEFVLVQDTQSPLSPRDVRRLWEMRHDEELVVARMQPIPAPAETGLMSRLFNWGRALPATIDRPLASGTQLIRRRAVEELAANPSRQQQLRIARLDGAERISRAAPQREGSGMVTRLKGFALGE
jgi:dolichol-phosphate mannosyltransferase